MARQDAISTDEYTYMVVFEPGENAGFVALVPALPGCVSHGKTIEQARKMIAYAIQGYLDVLRKHGQPIPASEEYTTEVRREAVSVNLARV